MKVHRIYKASCMASEELLNYDSVKSPTSETELDGQCRLPEMETTLAIFGEELFLIIADAEIDSSYWHVPKLLIVLMEKVTNEWSMRTGINRLH